MSDPLNPRKAVIALAFAVALLLWLGLITLGWLVYRAVRWVL